MGDGGSSNVEGGSRTASKSNPSKSNPCPHPPARRRMLTFGVSDQMTGPRYTTTGAQTAVGPPCEHYFATFSMISGGHERSADGPAPPNRRDQGDASAGLHRRGRRGIALP